MGRLSFTEYFHLLLVGREPTDDQRFFLDLLLIAIAEHGMMPSNIAARMTLAADPGSLHGAVAAGILGCGPVILGTSEVCAQLLEGAQRQVEAGASPAGVAVELARTIQNSGGKLPGFGHPVHRPLDPRAERILELADARGVSGPYVLLARSFRAWTAEVWGRPLTMNVAMPIAAVLLDLGFPAEAVKAHAGELHGRRRQPVLVDHDAIQQRPELRLQRRGGRPTMLPPNSIVFSPTSLAARRMPAVSGGYDAT